MNQAITAPAFGRSMTRLFRHFVLDGARAMLAMLLGAALLAAIPQAAAAEMGAKVNLNTADVEALQYIPGIGPGKAADIIRARAENGGFKNIDELLEVPGIGEKTLLDIEKYGTLKGGVSELSEEMRDNPPVKSQSARHEDGEDGKDGKEKADGG